MKITSFNGNEINVCHFQGRSYYAYSTIFDDLFNRKLELKEDIGIMTGFNNPKYAFFYQQLTNNGIEVINSFDSIDGEWRNVDKVGYILRALKKSDKEIFLICDGNDVLVNTFDGMIDKFKKSGYRILYNATTNNHPKVLIDAIYDRDMHGRFRYFNAGCCIGYREDLIKFYEECQKTWDSNPYNPWESEQLILRLTYKRYLENNDNTIGFDHNCEIFQTFCNTQIEPYGEDGIRVL